MNYQLTQTGEQVQDILNQAPTTEETLQAEITRSTNKDDALELAIGNEKTRAEGVESNLQTAIGNEKTRAEGAEANLQTAIGNEKTRAELVEGALRTDVDGINAKIPTGASSENKLATESFVNSSISTNTADFKGTYTSLEQLQTEVHDANANDYAFVISTDATGNTAYNRYKYVEGTGWVFEYALNNSSFTSSQWAAINSAITAALVAKLTGLPTATELTTQLNAIIDSVTTEKSRAEGIESGLRTDVNANATAIGTEKTRAEGVEATLSTAIGNEKTRAEGAELVLQQNINAEALLRSNADTALQTGIDGINAKIPTAASSSNQLADKAFVNSSIATNTAEFKGTYNSLAELQQVTGANANDYGFVISTDSAGNTVYNRYKYVEGTGWVFEYALNNSSFTAAQWASIQSGITAALVAKLNGLPDIDALNAMFAAITSKIPANASSSNKLVDYAQLVAALAGKQDTLIFDNVPTENSNNPVKSGGVYSAIATVTSAVVGLQSSKQDVLTFDQYPTAGSDNPVRSTGIYSAIENAVAPKANQTDLDNAVIRISTNEIDIAQLQAAYRGLTQNDVVTVAPTDTWPVANPQENVIYRVADRTNTPPQYYTDYMWNGTVMVEMAQYNNAIDPRPKKNSQNLVTSGGVFDNMGALDVSELNATENPHTLAQYADLSSALAAIPTDYQKGGMSIKFVQSSDNKYVQYRYMGTAVTGTPNPFLDTANWQGVDDEPTAGSENLVKSGGMYGAIKDLKNLIHTDYVLLDGQINTSTGVEEAHALYKHTAMLPLEEGYLVYGATVHKYLCYSASSFNQESFLGQCATNIVSKDDAPAGTKYISIQFYNQTYDNLVIISKKKISDFLGDTNFTLNNRYLQSSKEIFEKELNLFKYGIKDFYLYGSAIDITNKYVFRIVKYDGLEIRIYLSTYNGSNFTNVLDKTISVPANKLIDEIVTQGNYNIRFIADLNNIETFIDGTSSFFDLNIRAFSPIQGNIKKAEEDIVLIKNNIENLSEDIDIINKQETEDVDYLSYFETENGGENGFISAINGSAGNSSTMTRTTYIPLTNIIGIKVKTPQGSTAGLAFYSGNNASQYATEFISGINSSNGGTGTVWISIPEGAKYIRTTTNNSDITGETAVFTVRRYKTESLQEFVDGVLSNTTKPSQRATHILYGYEGFCEGVESGDQWIAGNTKLSAARNNLVLATENDNIRQIVSESQLYLNKMTYEVDFVVNDAGSFFSIGAVGLSLKELRVHNNNGSAIFEIYAGSAGVDTYEPLSPRVVISRTMSFALTAGNRYLLGMRYFENETYNNVEHMDGIVYYIKSYEDNVVYEEFVPRDSTQHESIRNGITASLKGSQFVSLKVGDITVINLFVSSEYDTIAKAIILGDSYVDGDTLIGTDTTTRCGQQNKYACLLQSAIGMKSFVIAGKGGDAMNQNSMPYLMKEVELFIPGYCIPAFGANHTTFDGYKTNMEAFCKWLESIGVVPILETVCPASGRSAELIAQMSNWVRNSGYRYVDLNKAVTVDGLGVTWKDGYVFSDGTHPTPLGHQAIFETFQRELPELFSV